MLGDKLLLRLEEEKDFKIVENVTREAFWNIHGPGCNEHYLIHVMRSCDAFIKPLDMVAEYEGAIVGNIVYTKSKIIGDDGDSYEVISFGPVSVLPEYQGMGVGKALIETTKDMAREMGYKAILIYGDPEYYKRVGFLPAEHFGIGTSDDHYATPLLACELIPGELDGKQGRFIEDEAFDLPEEEGLAFDKHFPEKAFEEGLPSQLRFLELVKMRRPRSKF